MDEEKRRGGEKETKRRRGCVNYEEKSEERDGWETCEKCLATALLTAFSTTFASLPSV